MATAFAITMAGITAVASIASVLWPSTYASPRRDSTSLGDEINAATIGAVRHSPSLRVVAVVSEFLLAEAGMAMMARLVAKPPATQLITKAMKNTPTDDGLPVMAASNTTLRLVVTRPEILAG